MTFTAAVGSTGGAAVGGVGAVPNFGPGAARAISEAISLVA
jgi:hypothetical protein